jgi:hypothetical protein
MTWGCGRCRGAPAEECILLIYALLLDEVCQLRLQKRRGLASATTWANKTPIGQGKPTPIHQLTLTYFFNTLSIHSHPASPHIKLPPSPPCAPWRRQLRARGPSLRWRHDGRNAWTSSQPSRLPSSAGSCGDGVLRLLNTLTARPLCSAELVGDSESGFTTRECALFDQARLAAFNPPITALDFTTASIAMSNGTTSALLSLQHENFAR